MYINIQSLSWHSELEVEDESKKQGLEIEKDSQTTRNKILYPTIAVSLLGWNLLKKPRWVVEV